MKFFLLLGGTAGLLLAFASGLLAGNEISIALRDGAIGCIGGALLMKGFHTVVMICIRDVAVERQKTPAPAEGGN